MTEYKEVEKECQRHKLKMKWLPDKDGVQTYYRVCDICKTKRFIGFNNSIMPRDIFHTHQSSRPEWGD